jgi:Protein of unknown function (DUF3618)
VTTSSDPEQIRRDIERTQAALSQDVDALAEKVTPGKIVERRVDRARDAATRLKEKVMGSDPYGNQHGVGGYVGDVRSAASTATDRVSGTASSAASSVQDAASSAAGTVQDAASSAAGAVQEAPAAIRRQTRGNPLAAGIIAFGAGWLVSSLLPASRREQELADQAKQVAQEKVQPAAQQVAQQVATEVKENLREPAQQAVESVRSTAQDAKDTVTDEGRSAAQDVQGRAQDAAGNVRSSTNGS